MDKEVSNLQEDTGNSSNFVAKTLLAVEAVPLEFRCVFSNYSYFNRIQSAIFEDVFHTDESLVVSAPTGSGKTVIFELAMVKTLNSIQNHENNNFKIIYVAPMKALCEERLLDWHKKFSNFNLNCISVTGDTDVSVETLSQHNVIITTPEKWDSLTRRWRSKQRFVETIKLFMVDEVHLLNDEARGPTLEVIVSRMKTIQTFLVNKIRFITVSATIPNIEDIAAWIGTQTKPSKYFWFGEEMRPVKLQKIVHGYNYNASTSTPFKFDIMLNYKLQSIMLQHSNGKPTLIFCSTRKSVEITAKHLSQNITVRLNGTQSAILRDTASQILDVTARELLVHGIACHHAGMLPDTRKIVEGLFRNGQLPVLVTTSTLAMGVNLPAHLVIIKSTKYYTNGEYRDYPESTLLQMIGRAGRPQFDTSATAVILTTAIDKPKYDNMVSGGQPIESSLHRHLTEHINAEVVLCTITDLAVAMQWISSTYLYIRACKHPKYYGLPTGLTAEQIDKKLLDMCQIEINKLRRVGMITMDQHVNILPTETGILMAKYYVHFETMKLFTEVRGSEILSQILGLLSRCHEFSDLYLRVNDKKSLNLLNKCKDRETIRFPLSGKIRTLDMKINCIIQAVFGSLQLIQSSLLNESQKIMRIGERITNCLAEYLEQKSNCYSALLSAIILSKCFHTRLWENSPYVTKQLTGIGSILSANLVAMGITTFQSILEANPRNLEMIIKRKCPMGNTIQSQVEGFPQYSLTLNEIKLSLATSVVQVTIKLHNHEKLLEDLTMDPESIMSLLIGDENNNILLYEKYTHSYMIENPNFVKELENSFTIHTNIFAHFISENWVGIDCESNLVLFPKITKSLITKKDDVKPQKTPKKSMGEVAQDKLNAKLNLNEKDKPHVRSFIDQYYKISKKNNNSSETSKNTNSKASKLISNPHSSKESISEPRYNTCTKSIETKHAKVNNYLETNPNKQQIQIINGNQESLNCPNNDLFVKMPTSINEPLNRKSKFKYNKVKKNKLQDKIVVEKHETRPINISSKDNNIISHKEENDNELKKNVDIQVEKNMEEKLLMESFDAELVDFGNYDNWNLLEDKLLESPRDQSKDIVKKSNVEETNVKDIDSQDIYDTDKILSECEILHKDILNDLILNEEIFTKKSNLSQHIDNEDIMHNTAELPVETCSEMESIDEITYGDATFNRDLEQFMKISELEALKKLATKNKSSQIQHENLPVEDTRKEQAKVASNISGTLVDVSKLVCESTKTIAEKQETANTNIRYSTSSKNDEKKEKSFLKTFTDSVNFQIKQIKDDKINDYKAFANNEYLLNKDDANRKNLTERNGSINVENNYEISNKNSPNSNFATSPSTESEQSLSIAFKNKFNAQMQRKKENIPHSGSSKINRSFAGSKVYVATKPKDFKPQDIYMPNKSKIASRSMEFERSMLKSSAGVVPFLSHFKHTPKKRLSHRQPNPIAHSNSVELSEPDSTIMLDGSPNKLRKLEKERKKLRIKWRSPLITSPEFKFSPKFTSTDLQSQPSCSFTITANLGLHAGKESENSDDILDASTSISSASENLYKAPRKQTQRTYTPYLKKMPLKTPKNVVNFPISDKQCLFSKNDEIQNTQAMYDKYNDFISDSFIETYLPNPKIEKKAKVISQDASAYLQDSNKQTETEKNELFEKTNEENLFETSNNISLDVGNDSFKRPYNAFKSYTTKENYQNYNLNPSISNDCVNLNHSYSFHSTEPIFTENMDDRTSYFNGESIGLEPKPQGNTNYDPYKPKPQVPDGINESINFFSCGSIEDNRDNRFPMENMDIFSYPDSKIFDFSLNQSSNEHPINDYKNVTKEGKHDHVFPQNSNIEAWNSENIRPARRQKNICNVKDDNLRFCQYDSSYYQQGDNMQIYENECRREDKNSQRQHKLNLLEEQSRPFLVQQCSNRPSGFVEQQPSRHTSVQQYPNTSSQGRKHRSSCSPFPEKQNSLLAHCNRPILSQETQIISDDMRENQNKSTTLHEGQHRPSGVFEYQNRTASALKNNNTIMEQDCRRIPFHENQNKSSGFMVYKNKPVLTQESSNRSSGLLEHKKPPPVAQRNKSFQQNQNRLFGLSENVTRPIRFKGRPNKLEVLRESQNRASDLIDYQERHNVTDGLLRPQTTPILSNTSKNSVMEENEIWDGQNEIMASGEIPSLRYIYPKRVHKFTNNSAASDNSNNRKFGNQQNLTSESRCNYVPVKEEHFNSFEHNVPWETRCQNTSNGIKSQVERSNPFPQYYDTVNEGDYWNNAYQRNSQNRPIMQNQQDQNGSNLNEIKSYGYMLENNRNNYSDVTHTMSNDEIFANQNVDPQNRKRDNRSYNLDERQYRQIPQQFNSMVSPSNQFRNYSDLSSARQPETIFPRGNKIGPPTTSRGLRYENTCGTNQVNYYPHQQNAAYIRENLNDVAPNQSEFSNRNLFSPFSNETQGYRRDNFDFEDDLRN